MANMMSYVDSCKFLTYMFGTQPRQQELMSEKDDYMIYENHSLSGYMANKRDTADKEDILAHYICLSK